MTRIDGSATAYKITSRLSRAYAANSAQNTRCFHAGNPSCQVRKAAQMLNTQVTATV